ncbi:sperm-associated antigen 1A [Cyclospora cayetanensis]|uniref:Sperm-associated antigen 1A n=1 Tax=Cyclospora cayetanensis TaxID=88456 RepID=A0A6P6RUD8_9EIME|nr:sperm-associated antigen 1A [Cyclospora cayetanensis]
MGSAEESSSGFPSPDLVGPPGGALGEEGSPMEASGPPGGPHEEDTCSEVSSMSGDEPLSAEEKLAMAISLKDAGNALFKEGQYEQALQKYKEGGKRVKGSSSSEAIAVSVQLSSNSCMCCLKLEKWQEAVEAANGVLQKEPKNLKALYRRALAKSNLGSLSSARDDLMAVLAVDKANADARKELHKLREKIQAAKEGDKKVGFLGVHCRAEKGESEEDFDTWLTRTKEAEEKEREEKQKQQAKSGTPLGGLKRRGSKDGGGSGSNNSSSVMEVDEEDAAIINETKKMDVSPWARTRFAERLQEAAANCGSAGMPSPEALLEVCRKATEALGSGGVKDEQAVQDVLKGCYSTKIETLNVQDVSGDAHLAVVRGSRRVFFDMKCSIKLKVSCSSAGPLALPGDDNSVLKEGIGGYESKGTLTLPDVSSADGSGMSWLQGCSVSLSSAPSPLLKPLVDEALAMYKESVAEKIQAFLDDCKALP